MTLGQEQVKHTGCLKDPEKQLKIVFVENKAPLSTEGMYTFRKLIMKREAMRFVFYCIFVANAS